MLSDRAIWSGGRTPRQEVRVLKVFTSGAPGRRPCLGAGSARWSYLRSPAFLVRTPRRSHLRSSLGPRGVLRGVVSSLFPSVFCSRRVEGVVAGRPLSPPRAFSVVHSLSAHWTPPSSRGAPAAPPPRQSWGHLRFSKQWGRGGPRPVRY